MFQYKQLQNYVNLCKMPTMYIKLLLQAKNNESTTIKFYRNGLVIQN